MKNIETTIKKENYSLLEVGNFSKVTDYKYQPSENFKIEGKIFLKELLDLTSMEISFNTMVPDAAIPYLHKHRTNEEIYIVISGKGQLLLDGDYVNIEEGSVVRVAPNTSRAIRNTGKNDFSFIVLQAKENSLNKGKTSDGYLVEEKPIWD